MKTGIGIFGLLVNNADVFALVNNRIFPAFSATTPTLPFITYDILNSSPNDTKTGQSKVDELDVEIVCHGATMASASELASAVRLALDRQWFSNESVTIDSIQFQTADVEVSDSPRKMMVVQEFKVRERRTAGDVYLGQPVIVTDGDGTIHEIQPGSTYQCIQNAPPTSQIPNPSASGIVYQRPTIGIVSRNVYAEGDERWLFENGYLPHPAPPVNPARVATAAIDNTYDPNFFPFALLQNENAFGNKYRWTNTAGKQGSRSTLSYSEPQFHYTDDWDGAIHGYVIDHLTGLAWTAYAVNPPNGNRSTSTLVHQNVIYPRDNYDWQSFANYAHGLNGEEQFERGGFRDWRLPTIHELATLLISPDGVQMGGAFTGCSPHFADESLNDWYNVRGETGTPPRTSTNWLWSSSAYLPNQFFMTQSSFIYPRDPATVNLCAGVFVRNHY